MSRTRTHQLRGVNPGDRADRVRRLCPDVAIRIRDVQLEQACWEGVLREINTVTPFMDGPDPPFVYFSACSLPEARALSVRLSAQIGAGENRSIARLAAIRSARGHVLEIPARRRMPFFHRFDLARLAELDFSVDMLEQLHLFGHHTLRDVCRLNRRHLEAQFGEEGVRLHDMLHAGESERIPLYVSPPAVEQWHAYDDPVAAEPAMLEPVLAELVERAGSEMHPFRCQRIRLAVHAEARGRPRWAERVLSSPRGNSGALFRLALPLMEQLMEPGIEVGRVGIRFESLRRPSLHQAALFDERPAVLGAVRTVHRRYPGLIRRAALEEHALFEEDSVTMEAFAAADP